MFPLSKSSLNLQSNKIFFVFLPFLSKRTTRTLLSVPLPIFSPVLTKAALFWSRRNYCCCHFHFDLENNSFHFNICEVSCAFIEPTLVVSNLFLYCYKNANACDYLNIFTTVTSFNRVFSIQVKPNLSN